MTFSFFFYFWRSTQTQRRDLKLSVPTLARNLFCLSALKRIQSFGPLKVPLRTPKGFMDPRLRTTARAHIIGEDFAFFTTLVCAKHLDPQKIGWFRGSFFHCIGLFSKKAHNLSPFSFDFLIFTFVILFGKGEQ